MHNEVGERLRMSLVREADFFEVPFRWGLGVAAVKQPVTSECQLVVVRRSATAGGGILPPAHPAGLAERSQSATDSGFAAKRLLECRAHFQQLPHSESAAVQDSQDFHVSTGE